MLTSRLFFAVPAVLALHLLGSQRMASATVSGMPRLSMMGDSSLVVAEAVLQPVTELQQEAARDSFYLLPAVIQGHHVSLILDTGSESAFMLFPVSLTRASIQIPELNYNNLGFLPIKIGTLPESRVRVWMVKGVKESAQAPPGFAPIVGVVGAAWLDTYNLLFDGPARRVRLYQPSTSSPSSDTSTDSSARHLWLPAGLTAHDCIPMRQERNENVQTDVADNFVHIWLDINGHRIPGIFDAGSTRVVVNEAAAIPAGVMHDTTRLHHVPANEVDNYANGVSSVKEEETADAHIALASHPLTVPLFILARLNPSQEQIDAQINHQSIPMNVPKDSIPYALIGRNAIHDRVMLVSYRTRQVCVGNPVSVLPSPVLPRH